MTGRIYSVPPLRIRRALPVDAGACVPLLRDLDHAFSATLLRALFTDDATVREGLERLLSNPACIGWVGCRDFNVLGVIVGLLSPHPMRDSLRVFSELFWAAPGHPKVARQLLEVFTVYGRSHADWTLCTVQQRTQAGAATLTKLGYHPHEAMYIRETPIWIGEDAAATWEDAVERQQEAR